MSEARWTRTRRFALALALLGALGLAAAVGFVAWRRTRPLRTFELPSLQGAPRFLDSGRAIALPWNVAGDSRRWHVLSLETGAELCALPGDVLFFSRGTGRVLRGSREKPLVLLDPVSGTRRTLLENWDVIYPLALSPGEDLLACLPATGARWNTVEIHSLAPEPPRAIVVGGAEWLDAEQAVFSRAGDRLAVEWGGTEAMGAGPRVPHVCVYKTSTGALETDVAGRSLLDFSGGDELLTSEGTGRVHSIRARDGAGVERLVVADVVDETLSASGTRLAACEGGLSSGEGGARRVFVVRDVATGAIVQERRPRERGQDGDVASLALSADGDRLAVAYEKGTVDVWELPPP